MIPTSGLRFVERTCQVPREPFFGGGTVEHKYRVLQQYWSTIATDPMLTFVPTGEWRDVPLAHVDVAE